MAQNRTPLRYPGGKQKLTPFIAEVILANGLEGGSYVEPYAGGAGVAMELLFDGYIERAYLNDSSYHIYSFWDSVLNHTDEFCARISRALISIDEWLLHREVLRNPDQHSRFDVGFSTFYLNRTNRSGVLTGGVIGGLDQSGKWKLDARFSKNELIQRVESIGEFRESIEVSNFDAEDFFSITINSLPENTLIYCDPPYFEKASRLYLNHYKPDDHERIAKTIQGLHTVKWMVSYDGVQQILDYYPNQRKFLYELQYNASRAYKGSEVFIFSENLVIPRNSSLPHINCALKRNSQVLYA